MPPVLALMRGMERALQRLGEAGVHRAARRGGAQLVSLAGIAALGVTHQRDAIAADSIALQLLECPRLELRDRGSKPLEVGVREILDLGRAEVIRDIAGEQPESRGQSRSGRHDHHRDRELARDVAADEGPRAAEGDQLGARCLTRSPAPCRG